MSDDAFVARYLVTGGSDFEKRAELISIGQTSGAWHELSPELKEAVRPHLGRVVSVEKRGSSAAEISIAFPLSNVGTDLGALITAAFGKVSMDGAIRWIDLEVPASFASKLGGPALGVPGLRELWQIPRGRPLLMAILKPCLGLDPEDLGKLFESAARGGADIIKDDEVLAGEAQAGDAPIRRLSACRAAAERARAVSGKRCRHAIHLSGPSDELVERAERLLEHGAECFLVNAFVYGLPFVQALRKRLAGRAAIMAHPAFSGAITSSETHGVSAPLLLGKLTRLAGADLALFPSPYGSVALPKPVALDLARALLDERSGIAPAFPVPSAGIKVEHTKQVLADFGPDSVVNAGTGIFGHAGGAEAGASAFRRAIDEAVASEARS